MVKEGSGKVKGREMAAQGEVKCIVWCKKSFFFTKKFARTCTYKKKVVSLHAFLWVVCPSAHMYA